MAKPRTRTPLILANLPIQLAASTTAARSPLASGATFRALGYRQTKLTAAQGGVANANGFRVRNEGMRALGRSFRGKTFVTGHNKGDTRARGGTIVDAWAEELSTDELGIMYDIALQAAWAKQAYDEGLIDRFSFSINPVGEITCTIHNVPVWTGDCFCFPGETVDGAVAEWEVEDADGNELSSVNVPAVEGTGVIAAAAFDDVLAITAPRAARGAALTELCGRAPDRARRQGGAPVGDYSRPAPARTMAERSPDGGAPMDRELICKSLGLPPTATDAEIKAKLAEITQAAAQVSVLSATLEQNTTDLATARQREADRTAELDAAHVTAEIARLRSTRQVTDRVVDSLQASAKTGRVAFDAALALVEAAAAPVAPGPSGRATLQSDARAVDAQASAVEPDAYDLNRSNPNLRRYMKGCGITEADMRKHGAVQFNVVPNLKELADATVARGA